jgi:hypothetical protein
MPQASGALLGLLMLMQSLPQDKRHGHPEIDN